MSGTMDPMATEVDQQELAQQLLAQAREQGIDLVGPDGLLNRLTKNVLETGPQTPVNYVTDGLQTTKDIDPYRISHGLKPDVDEF